MTAVEIVLAVTISTIIAGPVLAWGLFAVDQQRRTGDDLKATNGAALLGTWFDRDVPQAAAVVLGPQGCDGSSKTDGGTVRLTLVGGVGNPSRQSYVEVTAVEDGVTRRSIWRRSCSPSGALVGETELVPRVDAGSTSADCIPATGPTACAGVELRTTPSGLDQLVLRASRRVNTAAVALTPGNRPPRAVITPSATSGNYPLTVTFDPSASTDAEGALALFEWEFPGGVVRSQTDPLQQQSWTFDRPGIFLVILTVTDAAGATHTAYLTVEVTNRPPTAVATVSPASGTLGTTFTFDASGSTDPEETTPTDPGLKEYRWNFGGDSRTTTSPTITYQFPVGSTLGDRVVALTVVDRYDAIGETALQVNLTGRVPTVSAPQFSPARGANNVVALPVRFSATACDPDVVGCAVSAWDWKVLNSAGTVVWTSTSASPTLSAAPSGVGNYTVSVRVQGATGLWSDWTPPAAFAVAPPAPAAPTWVKDNLPIPGAVKWTTVPGAQYYTVQVNQSTETCYKVWTVTAPSPQPATIQSNYGSCFNWWFDARVSVTVNGVTSAWSPWTRRL